jgi:O-glycosyl hydrolase
MNLAGIEGVSFEYWSPPPYWKASGKYVADYEESPLNTLRPFGPDFENDPVYKGDREAFFEDFADAIVSDIKTLADAGIRTSMFGLQNEPDAAPTGYSSNMYFSSEDYLEAFLPVASRIRAYDPTIMIHADGAHSKPHLERIKPGMSDPRIVDLIDLYAVHTIGWDSSTVKDVHKYVRGEFPLKPWMQNEYEYLTGGATPERSLNTVQHIMNSFQIGENPSWFWLHALKPAGNAEASGYALGFWNSMIAPNDNLLVAKRSRWRDGPEFISLPAVFDNMEFIYPRRGAVTIPGIGYDFYVDQPSRLYLLVDDTGSIVPQGWNETDMSVTWEGGRDKVFIKDVRPGNVQIPPHDGELSGGFGAPHAVFAQALNQYPLEVSIGVNKPIYVESQQKQISRLTENLKPGHWTYNPLNWNSVGSFVKRMPWDSIVLGVTERANDEDARLLAFERPNGKRTLVLSNRHAGARQFNIKTNIDGAVWRGYRYTPYDGGEGTLGVDVGEISGGTLMVTLPSLSWEFWEEQ